MAQRGIRECDAKQMWSTYSWHTYLWYIITSTNIDDALGDLQEMFGDAPLIVKPDQLFGKRGKHGLIGVKLSASEVLERVRARIGTEQQIGEVSGVLDTFLVELFVPHDQEYYVAIKTDRDHDVIYFSREGGVEVEENWEQVSEVKVWLIKEDTTLWYISWSHMQVLWIDESIDSMLVRFIEQLYAFFVEYDLSYLEVNPFVIVDESIVCLDMVAKVDSAAQRKQKKNWCPIKQVKPFGSVMSDFEKQVEKMDAETWASLTLSTLNPNWRIAVLFWWGWASMVFMDAFGEKWLLDEIMDYGELSSNPSYRHNREFVVWLVDMLLNSPSTWQKRFCYLWTIANFTNIWVFAKAFVDGLESRVSQMKDQSVHILVRRGGVDDTKWLNMIREFCTIHNIPHEVYGWETYISSAVKNVE